MSLIFLVIGSFLYRNIVFKIRLNYLARRPCVMTLPPLEESMLTLISCRYGQTGMDPNGSTVSEGGIAITVDVNMPEDSLIQELRSPSHPIAVALGRTSTSASQPPHLSNASATLSLGTSTLEKDFVLEIIHQVRQFGVTPSSSLRGFNLVGEELLDGGERISSPSMRML